MYRTALDSDHLDVFTYPSDFILTYSDLVTDPQGFAAAHPGRQIVYIDRGLGDPGLKASIADVEKDALTLADMPAWLDERAARGVPYLTMYVNRGNLAAADAAVAPRKPWRWVATLDGTLAIAGLVPLRAPALVQFAGENLTGIHADFSLVLNGQWRPSPAPALPQWVIDAAGQAEATLGTVAAGVVQAQAFLRTISG